MKLPKKLIICGNTYQIKYNPKHNGGSFSCNTQVITIGTRDTKEATFRVLIHEILEIILSERDHRYQLNRTEVENGDYLFSFNHSQYENVAYDLAYVLRQMI